MRTGGPALQPRHRPKQVGEILFGKLGIPVQAARRPAGAPSTDEDVLTELAADYPLPARLLEHRSARRSSRAPTPTSCRLMVNPADRSRAHQLCAGGGRDRAACRATTPTCRTSRSAPPRAASVREAFIAPPGHVILSADYSQIELRIMAHISEDPGLLKAFAARPGRAPRHRERSVRHRAGR